eukprot:CAMPEP_0168424370 /NCGR_PEP_ID=MMETSP0228-20121227/34788_1 /TAXON_ID=133427 /ORGANISM="Protoceratium reticulatum, Strain CCCM 535 (=CCMP 1889)" /LENGTH=125 /DNA_ID=CAMNT_0008438359 /DNA_START=704 /DNA_END=1079 /DNA_ORIENTATION=+
MIRLQRRGAARVDELQHLANGPRVCLPDVDLALLRLLEVRLQHAPEDGRCGRQDGPVHRPAAAPAPHLCVHEAPMLPHPAQALADMESGNVAALRFVPFMVRTTAKAVLKWCWALKREGTEQGLS